MTSEDPSSPPYRGHVGAWALWLAAAALPALTTRNPAYLLLLLLATAVVQLALPRASPRMAGWGFFLKAGLLLWLFTIPLNALTVHAGTTVLFTLPRSIPLIGSIVGGPITLEATAYGFLSGLGLLAVILVFVTFNRAVDAYRLLRHTPAVLFHTGVTTTIALTFVPQATVTLGEIREAQAIRGHRWRGLRDLLPLILPLLTTALERALQLAESMEARGFATPPVRSQAARRWGQRLLLLSLLLLLAGLVWRGFEGGGPTSHGALLAGAAGLVAALALHNRSVRRTHHRQLHWTRRDTVVALCSGLSALGSAFISVAHPDLLSYYPYPSLQWPDFHPAVGALFLALTAPAWLATLRRS